MRRIILPQAMIVAIPNPGNSLISLLKSTSLAFTIGVMDMLGKERSSRATICAILRYISVWRFCTGRCAS